MTVSAQVDQKVRLHVENRHEMDLQLQSKEADLVEHALLYRDRGILVIRHSPCDFTIALSRKVPFGETLEVDRS